MREDPTECRVKSKKDKERRSTIHHEETMEAGEDTEVEVEDEEEVKSCATIAISHDILLGIARIPVRPVDIVMQPTMSLKIVLSY